MVLRCRRTVVCLLVVVPGLGSAGRAVPAAWAADARFAALQTALHARGLYAGTVDGVAGPGTAAAVRRLQRRSGLAVDGVAGPATLRALGWRGRPHLGARPLLAGLRGFDVAELQFLLARAGFPSAVFDGRFGAHTDAALRRFQAWAGLAPDGRTGPATLRVLGRAAPRSPLRLRPPVAAPVSDRFRSRGARFHAGIDYRAAAGTPVAAAAAGCVVRAGWSAGGYGRLIVLRHAQGLTSWYAHLRRVEVRRGTCVGAGAHLGRAGASGRATGPHLHLELRLRGAAVDPATAGL